MPPETESVAPIAQSSSKPGLVIDDFVRHLITHSPRPPCEAIAKVYREIVPPEKHFQVALDVLYPILCSESDVASRIAAGYIIYDLYSAHPFALNPFRHVYLEASQGKSAKALENAVDPIEWAEPTTHIKFAFMKIMTGMGKDLGPATPEALATRAFDGKKGGAGAELPKPSQTSKPAPASKPKPNPTPNGNATPGRSTAREESESSLAIQYINDAAVRTLTLAEQRTVKSNIPNLETKLLQLDTTDFRQVIIQNPDIAHPILLLILTKHIDKRRKWITLLGSMAPLPPVFDVLGRLLKETALVNVKGLRVPIGEVIRAEVLGSFLHMCMTWFENSAPHLDIGTDRLDVGIAAMCRFYKSLLTTGIIDITSDAETAEMKRFSLLNSRLEEANTLYRILATGRI